MPLSINTLTPDQEIAVANMTLLERINFFQYKIGYALAKFTKCLHGKHINHIKVMDAIILEVTGRKVLNGPLFQVECKIGEGAFAKVYKCRRPSGEIVAIKEIKIKNKGDEKEFERIQTEIAIMEIWSYAYDGLDDNYERLFVQIHDWHMIGSTFYLVMEYCPLGSLEDWMKSRGCGLDPEIVGWYAERLIVGIHIFHKTGMLHRDLKPKNILVWTGPDGIERLKIADFGIGKLSTMQSGQSFDEDAEHTQRAGTENFMAPEVYDGQPYSIAADVYSIGKIIAYMLLGPEKEDMAYTVDKCGYPIFVKHPEWDCHTTVIGRMMCENKDQRLKLADVLDMMMDQQHSIVIQHCPAPCNKKLTNANGILVLF